MIYFYLLFSGLIAFSISTLTAGGGALMLLPVLSFLIGSSNVAPVLNLGNFIGRPIRLFLFWKNIKWEVVKYYVPPSILGAWFGASLLAKMESDFLQFFIGIFLVSTIFQFQFGKKKRSFEMKLTYFIPLGLIVPFISTLTGALGPLLNPFLLNYEMTKEELIATKTASSFFTGIVQIASYSFFGLMNKELWIWGLVLGLGIGLGNWIGKALLKKISEKSFRQFAILFMVLSGIILIYQSIV